MPKSRRLRRGQASLEMFFASFLGGKRSPRQPGRHPPFIVKRGQASLEMFFALSLFVLVLFWTNNFLQAASTEKQDVLFTQKQILSANLAKIANTACLLNEKITIQLPCIFSGTTPQAYGIIFEGKRVLVDDVSATTACSLNPTQLIARQCDVPTCLTNTPTGVSITGGACS